MKLDKYVQILCNIIYYCKIVLFIVKYSKLINNGNISKLLF